MMLSALSDCAVFKPRPILTADAYIAALRDHLQRAWQRPADKTQFSLCIAQIEQGMTGEVLGVEITECDANKAERRALKHSIRRASPLPLPDDMQLLEANLELRFKPPVD